jgi:hypothetical protein
MKEVLSREGSTTTTTKSIPKIQAAHPLTIL